MGPRYLQPELPENAYLAAVEADNDRLRLRVEELEKEVTRLTSSGEFIAMTPVAKFGFTQSESAVFARLAGSGYASNEDLLAVCSGKGSKVPKIKVIDVYICKIRKKVEPYDIVIETVHGRGYKIGPESRKIIAAIQAGTDSVLSR